MRVTSKVGAKRDTKIQAELQEPRKAGRDECCNSRKPKPPIQKGRVACNHALSEHIILLRQLRRSESNKDGKQPKDEEGIHHNT